MVESRVSLSTLFDKGGPLAELDISQEKRFQQGTHRCLDPEDTLRRLTPHLPTLGITRVATITGLDKVNIPVVMCTRPHSRSLAVSQGKGRTLAAARVSAIMESLENHHAERIDNALRLCSEAELCRSEQHRPSTSVPPAGTLPGIIDTAGLPRSTEAHYHPDARLLWIEGLDLMSGQSLWLPFETVHTDFRLPRPDGQGFFPGNSNGLASGNTVLEAMIHALCEVIERDALSLWQQTPERARRAIAPDSVDDRDCCELLEQLNAADLGVHLWDVSSDVGVPCFRCLISNRDDAVDPEFGSGCHPDRGIALQRAITEAVQARTTFIAGSRDDYGHGPYSPQARHARRLACAQLASNSSNMQSFTTIDSYCFSRFEADLDWLLTRLWAVGIRQVAWIDLSRPGIDLAVGRMVVPGLEGAGGGADGDYVPGARAQALLA